MRSFLKPSKSLKLFVKKHKIILIGLLILFILYLTLVKSKDYFTVNENAIVNCLNKNNIITKLYPNNTYFSIFNETDKKTRNISNFSNDKIRDHYLNNINDFTKKDKDKLNNVITNILNEINSKNKKQFLLSPWNFVKFSNIENDFPHTHENLIFLPKLMIDSNLSSDYNKQTLVHEKVHIFQRTHPQLFNDLYENYWHFKKKPIKNIKLIENQARTNPDGLDNNWVFCYNNVNIMLCAIYNDDASNISHTQNYGVYLNENNGIYSVSQPIKKNKIQDIDAFSSFFGNIKSNNYHPNEIVAELIPRKVFNQTNNSLGFKKLEEWWNKIH